MINYETFPRVPWIMQNYAKALNIDIDDLLQVTNAEYDSPLLMTSKTQYDLAQTQEPVQCVWCADIPTREERPQIQKSLLTPMYGGEIYFETPEDERNKTIIFVDDCLRIGERVPTQWATLSVLQYMFKEHLVLGGVPDKAFDWFDKMPIVLLLCDHNLWYESVVAQTYF